MIDPVDANLKKRFETTPLEDIKMAIGDDLLNYVSDYLDDLGVVNHQKIIPLYFSSLGAHIMNLLNVGCAVDGGSFCPFYKHLDTGCGRYGRESKSPNFLTKFNMHQDLRAHIMYVAPSGYSKNFFMDMFMDPKYGFLVGTSLPFRKPKSLTEAAYTGTLGGGDKDKRGEPVYGLAKYYCSGILGITEFSSLTNMSDTTHSSNLMNFMLEGLETGEIDKFLGQGNIHYYTYHTLWGATQPGYRFDLSSGMGRRLNFHLFIPTKEEEKQYEEAQDQGYTVRPNETILTYIRGYIYKLWNTVNITGVRFSEEYEDWKRQHEVIRHTDYNLFDNIAMGYNFVVNYIPQYSGEIGVLTVKLDQRLKSMLEDLVQARKMLTSESLVEWLMFLHEMDDQPMSMYQVIRQVQEKQLLTWSDAVQRMKMALDEGIFGQFKYEGKNGEHYPVVYKKSLYSNVQDAVVAWSEAHKDNNTLNDIY